MNRRSALTGAAAALFAFPASSGASAVRPKAAHAFTISGEEFLLTDIIAPIDRASSDSEPFARQALAVQQALLAEGDLDISAMQARDRWGRRAGVAHLRRPGVETAPLQLLLVKEGAARVAPASDSFGCIQSLLEAEDEARHAKRGLWALAAYAPIDANACCQRISPTFHVAHGSVVSAALRGGRIYINFGPDYRTDFTVSVLARTMKKWRTPIDADSVMGRTIEARGHVDFYNGPAIELTHEMQVRFMDETRRS